MSTFWVLEVKDGVVISEEVDLVDPKRMRSYLLDDGLDDLIAANCSLADHFHLPPLRSLSARARIAHLAPQLFDVGLDFSLRQFHLCNHNNKY